MPGLWRYAGPWRTLSCGDVVKPGNRGSEKGVKKETKKGDILICPILFFENDARQEPVRDRFLRTKNQ
jgi:hypothetical protein